MIQAAHNNQVNATAKPLRGLAPSALRAPAARYLGRYAAQSVGPLSAKNGSSCLGCSDSFSWMTPEFWGTGPRTPFT